MFTFATGVNADPGHAALLLLTLIRGAPTLYVAADAPEPPEPVRMAMGALSDGVDQGLPNERLATLIAEALQALTVYFQAPVEIDLHVCRKTKGPALLFAPAETATVTTGGDTTSH